MQPISPEKSMGGRGGGAREARGGGNCRSSEAIYSPRRTAWEWSVDVFGVWGLGPYVHTLAWLTVEPVKVCALEPDVNGSMVIGALRQ